MPVCAFFTLVFYSYLSAVCPTTFSTSCVLADSSSQSEIQTLWSQIVLRDGDNTIERNQTRTQNRTKPNETKPKTNRRRSRPHRGVEIQAACNSKPLTDIHICDLKLLEILLPPPSNTPPSPHWLYDLQYIHDKLMHSFHNRQVRPLKGFIVSTHRLSSPPPPTHPPPPRSLLFKPRPPRP